MLIMIETLYQDTLIKLKKGIRPQIKLTPELISELQDNWKESLNKVLCILDHTQNTCSDFNQLLFHSFEKTTETDTLIYLLAASQKHIISHAFMTGNMIPIEFFDIMKKLLQTKNSDLLEWTLRTAESMGPLNRRIQQEIRQSRPGLNKFFSSHLRACDEIINSLEQQWKKN
jgi:hypothetical protein